MGEVDAVFEDVLRMHFQRLAVIPLLRVVIVDTAVLVETREDVGGFEERIAPLDVVPDVDGLIALDDRIGANAATPVWPILVGNADVAALVIPLPAVEGALDDLTVDVTAVAEMSAEVLAVGVHHGQLTGLRAPRDHLGVEVRHPADVTGLDLVGPGDLEPTCRLHRQRWLGHTQMIEQSM